MKNKLREFIQRCFTVTTKKFETNNLLDNKKDNFIITGQDRLQKWIFCFKIQDHTKIVKQKFADDKSDKGVGF